MSILDRPTDERPREKLQAKGAAILSDYELLMAMIGSGTAQADVTTIAKRVHTLISPTAARKRPRNAPRSAPSRYARKPASARPRPRL